MSQQLPDENAHRELREAGEVMRRKVMVSPSLIIARLKSVYDKYD
jgi:hypothetical protein